MWNRDDQLHFKAFLLYVWTAVNKVRSFNLQRFFINILANSQSWENLAAGSVNSALSLNHISDLRWYISSRYDRKEKFWGHSDSKITDSLHHFITNAQIGDILLFFYLLLNYNFSPVSCSLDNLSTICYLEVVLQIFLTLFYPKMANLPLSSNKYNFSNKF